MCALPLLPAACRASEAGSVGFAWRSRHPGSASTSWGSDDAFASSAEVLEARAAKRQRIPRDHAASGFRLGYRSSGPRSCALWLGTNPRPCSRWSPRFFLWRLAAWVFAFGGARIIRSQPTRPVVCGMRLAESPLWASLHRDGRHSAADFWHSPGRVSPALCAMDWGSRCRYVRLVAARNGGDGRGDVLPAMNGSHLVSYGAMGSFHCATLFEQ